MSRKCPLSISPAKKANPNIQHRPLLPALFGLILGALAILIPVPEPFGAAGAGFAALAALSLLITKRPLAPALFLAAWAWGFGGGALALRAQALDSRADGAGLSGLSQVRWIEAEGTGLRVRSGDLELRLGEGAALAGLAPGDWLAWEGTFSRPRPQLNPGGWDGRLYSLSQGLAGQVHVRAVRIVDGPRARGLALLRRWAYGAGRTLRSRIRERLGSSWELAAGLILGDRASLSPADREAFSDSSLSHLLAVSGMNIAVTAALVLGLGRALGLGLNPSRFATLGAVIFHVLLVGCPAPAVRAGWGAGLFLGARMLGRPVDGLSVLLLAALALLLPRPLALFDPSLQLSFLAAAALLAWAGPGTKVLEKSLPRWLASGLAISILAQLATTPASLQYFHSAYPLGALANLPAVPMAELASLLGGFLALIPDALYGAVFSPLAESTRLLLDGLMAVARISSRFPLVCVKLPSPPGWITVAVSLGILALAFRALAPAPRRALAWGLAGALLLYPAYVARPRGDLLARLALGRGEAVFLRSSGQAVLMLGSSRALGTGGLRDVISFLRQEGVRRLDAVLVGRGGGEEALDLRECLAEFPVHSLILTELQSATRLELGDDTSVTARPGSRTGAKAGELEIEGRFHGRAFRVGPKPDWFSLEPPGFSLALEGALLLRPAGDGIEARGFLSGRRIRWTP